MRFKGIDHGKSLPDHSPRHHLVLHLHQEQAGRHPPTLNGPSQDHLHAILPSPWNAQAIAGVEVIQDGGAIQFVGGIEDDGIELARRPRELAEVEVMVCVGTEVIGGEVIGPILRPEPTPPIGRIQGATELVDASHVCN